MKDTAEAAAVSGAIGGGTVLSVHALQHFAVNGSTALVRSSCQTVLRNINPIATGVITSLFMTFTLIQYARGKKDGFQVSRELASQVAGAGMGLAGMYIGGAIGVPFGPIGILGTHQSGIAIANALLHSWGRCRKHPRFSGWQLWGRCPCDTHQGAYEQSETSKGVEMLGSRTHGPAGEPL